MTPEIQEELKPIIKSFQERASKLRNAARFTLLIIVGVLILGIGIFYFAGAIANSESNLQQIAGTRNRLLAAKDDVRYAKSKKDEAIKRKDDLEQLLESEINGKLTAGNTSGVAGKGRRAEEIEQQRKEIESEIRQMDEKIGFLQGREEDLTKELAVIEEQNKNPLKDQNQLWTSISAIATRIGAVILLLFLVKILVPLYRYNIKLASFYSARADALQLFSIQSISSFNDVTFEKLALILTPVTIDFDAAPITPAEQGLELAKYIIESQKGK